MKVVDFKKEFDEKYERLERFNELDRTNVIVIENDMCLVFSGLGFSEVSQYDECLEELSDCE